MDKESLLRSINEYEAQLEQINVALEEADGEDRENLLSLQNDILQLITLTKESLNQESGSNLIEDAESRPSTSETTSNNTNMDDEYSLFMTEMKKDGVIQQKYEEEEEDDDDIKEELKMLEGKKCKAPHKHQWGDTVYHNALITSVLMRTSDSYEDIKVKVIFINPTHQEMLFCPFLSRETSCKFSDEQCKYSHGEIVDFASLQEYNEPQFDLLRVGGQVLAKQQNNLWQRATVKKLLQETCLVKYHTSNKEAEVPVHETYPLTDGSDDDNDDGDSDNDKEENLEEANEAVINMSLMNPSKQSFGDWEKHTNGVGSKLMQKMGYIIGTGLGKNSDGRIDPVSAVILPSGKSLDFCMNLRDLAGGDKDLFSVERKLKRLQKRQEKQNQKAYEREKNKTDVFNFLNKTISGGAGASTNARTSVKNQHRQDIKKETCRNLNVASLQMEENIKKCNVDIFKLKESLTRHTDVKSQMHKSLKSKLLNKEEELKLLMNQSVNIKNEQKIRRDEKKMTIF